MEILVSVMVVQVRDVRVVVDERLMRMLVGVPAIDVVGSVVGGFVRVAVLVVLVVIVIVVVAAAFVVVEMFMPAPQHEGNAADSDPERKQLASVHRFAQHEPSDHRAYERCRSEHQLTASGPEFASTRHPQRDRRSVSERTDDECPQHRTQRWRRGEYQPDTQVRPTSKHTFDERDVARRELVECGGGTVVDSPTQARCSDQQSAPAEVGLTRSGEDHAADDHESGADQNMPPEMLAKQQARYQRGEDQFEIEQERRRGGGDQAETHRQQHRPDGAAEHDREGEVR